ncbi:hypothetical protein K1719_021798 [Acacia pycnantha]|nr:hypothetical protein K1719_021798 [Acacia pycnantha]
MMSRWRGVPRNDDTGDTRDQKSIFNFPGRVVGKRSRSTLDGRDKRVAEWYILNNCEEAAQYLNKGDHSTMRRLIATLGKKVVPLIRQSGLKRSVDREALDPS